MRTPFLTFLISLFFGLNLFSQTNLNEYKYVIVPSKYDFLNESDKYQLNALSKFLFDKYGFNAFLEGETLPDELNNNRCKALNANLVSDKSLFKTKLTLVLKNCNGQEVYRGPVGESREKEYEKAYVEATRNAFEPLELLNYKYKPDQDEKKVAVKMKPKTKKPVETPSAQKEYKTPPVKPQTPRSVISVQKDDSEVLYAQEITNGFQLVDMSPKVVYRMFNTQMANLYLVESTSAIIYKQDEHWIYEGLENGVVVQKKLTIKF